jgi:serine/threonine protein kinase
MPESINEFAMTTPDPDKTVPPKSPGKITTLNQPDSSVFDSAELRAGGRFGRYAIQRILGEGGMGAVYLAHDTTLDRLVALKIPKFSGNVEMAAARFLREAQSAARLQHPNICPIYDLGVVNGTHYLAMAFVRGVTLAAYRTAKPLDPREAARLVRQISVAMQYAHEQNVIHRDLKPVNILIDDRGEPVVLDFGLARRGDAADRPLTVQGEVMGTPSYMPPEQVSGDIAAMGPASDIYSLGVVLYELLTGTPPFRGDLFAILSQIAMDAPKAPSALSKGLDSRFDSICLKALAKKPGDRWKSMRAFADALVGLAEPGGRATEGATITLKVMGTNFAYRPPSLLPSVTVGRQKRKPGDPQDQGNDFVLRVAGDDGLSARISRRHFELQRTSSGWSVIDRSKAGLTRNGEPLPKELPVELADGDRLGVAGVVTLEVAIRGGVTDDGIKLAALVEVAAPAGSMGRLQIEASVGEMVTIE